MRSCSSSVSTVSKVFLITSSSILLGTPSSINFETVSTCWHFLRNIKHPIVLKSPAASSKHVLGSREKPIIAEPLITLPLSWFTFEKAIWFGMLK